MFLQKIYSVLTNKERKEIFITVFLLIIKNGLEILSIGLLIPILSFIADDNKQNFIYDYLCLRDAVDKDFDIIIELGLITSALSIIFCRHKGKLIATNIDGKLLFEFKKTNEKEVTIKK